MHFCTKCQNLYYIKITEENEDKLIYYCRKCGHESNNLNESLENVCVSKSEKDSTENDNSYKHIINKYTKLDPTLPRIYNIKCPNADCISNISESINDDEEGKVKDDEGKDGKSQKGKGKVEHEILYLRYDDTNMKFVYICSNCDTIWKSSSNK